MIKGSTVIMSDRYIDILSRYVENSQRKLNCETNEYSRKKLQKELEYYQIKLDKALEFQDVIEQVLNVDIPSLTAIKTVKGYVLPINNVKVV